MDTQERAQNYPEGYKQLYETLLSAMNRAATGKGKERHATDAPFPQQPICTELRQIGVEPAIFQIRKKAMEALRMDCRGAANELLDVIVYAAAAVIIVKEIEHATGPTYRLQVRAEAPRGSM